MSSAEHAIPGPAAIAGQLTGILLLVAANGFFVAAEFAIVKVRATQVASRVRKGGFAARNLAHVVHHLDAYLSATQLGITLASLALGWVGEPFVASLFEPLFMRFKVSAETGHLISLTAAFSFITFLHILLGELVPKSLAIRRPLATSLATAFPLRLFNWTLFPLIWTLNRSSDMVLRLAGLESVSHHDLSHSEEELRLILAGSAQGPRLGKVQQTMMLRIMELKRRRTESIMVPRSAMAALPATLTCREALERATREGFSRFPVYGEDLDEILGNVHVKDLMKLAGEKGGEPLGGAARRCRFIPEAMPLDRLLLLLRSERIHMAIVVNEYGGTAGLVTLEDVLETIVGEIQDESDEEEPEVVPAGSNSYLVSGDMALGDLEKALGIELSEDDVQTLTGFLMARLGHMPRAGDETEDDGWSMRVQSIRRRRVDKVLIRLLEKPEGP